MPPVSNEPEPAEAAAQPTVAELLQLSRQANLERIREGNTKRKDSTSEDYKAAEAHAARALELREQAHELDPAHTDPEWANDKVDHAIMCDFLRAYPSIP